MPVWRVLTSAPGAPPASRLDEGLPDQAAGRTRLAAVRLLPGVMKATLHLCPHAAGERAGWWNCKRDPRAQYQVL